MKVLTKSSDITTNDYEKMKQEADIGAAGQRKIGKTPIWQKPKKNFVM